MAVGRRKVGEKPMDTEREAETTEECSWGVSGCTGAVYVMHTRGRHTHTNEARSGLRAPPSHAKRERETTVGWVQGRWVCGGLFVMHKHAHETDRHLGRNNRHHTSTHTQTDRRTQHTHAHLHVLTHIHSHTQR